MRRGARAFTLMELLTVMAIIAVLAAMLAPAIQATKAAVQKSQAGRSLKQLHTATTLYMADADDQYPLAQYRNAEGRLQTWFGNETAPFIWDTKAGILSGYIGGKVDRDPSFHARRYMGDGRGFGYNHGYIGSDFHVTRDYSNWPNSRNAAYGSMVVDPGATLVFTTTAYYYVTWRGGTGMKYDFGFVDPPSLWHGVPNMDFRHLAPPVIDSQARRVDHQGQAMAVFASGNVRHLRPQQVRDAMFMRDPPPAP